MTYPGAIPQPSTPGFVSGGGGHVVDPRIGGFERGMKTLLDAIAERKRQELAEMQFKAKQQEQAQAVQTTEELGQGLKELANKLGMPVPGMNLGGAGVMAPFAAKQADPTQAAIASMSDYAAGKMAPLVASGVQQEVFRRQQPESKSPGAFQLVVGDDGFYHSVDKMQGSSSVAYDVVTGQPLKAPDSAKGIGQPKSWMVQDKRTGQLIVADSNGGQQRLDPNLIPMSAAPAEAKRQAGFYIQGAPQYAQLVQRGMPGLTKGAWNFLNAIMRGRSKSTVSDLMSEYNLSDEDKQTLDSVFDLTALELYGRSGAAVRADELTSAILARVPLAWASPQRRKDKYARIQRALQTAYMNGLPAFQRMPDEMRAGLVPTTDVDQVLGDPVPGGVDLKSLNLELLR